MFRRITLFAAVFSLTLAAIAPAANAGCGSRRCSPRSSFRPTIRYSRPVVRYTNVVRVQPPRIIHNVAPKVVVAPRPARPQLPTVPSGSTMTLPANFLGSQPGDVFMVFNKIKLPIKVQQWSPTGVTVTLPPMAIKSAVEIRVDIVLPNGNLAVSRQVRVTKPASVVLHPTSPASPLPTQDAIQQQSGPQRQPAPTQPVAIAPPNVQPSPRPQVGQPIVLQQQPAPTQPVAIAPPIGQPSPQPQVGQPIVLPNGPTELEDNAETNPILQEHNEQPAVEAEVETPAEPSAPSVAAGDPSAAISKLIGG